ncbi:GTP cyclohydrolase II [Pleurotus ostreatus]|uniref:GTP cyclohydrolase II n=1 Tax=Pleurotus ostreatus TaxID=5322 RepID=A0A8H6ZVH2_PLEOS|nr:GTP cyclohydrolase II [Pleurotus ostreatus]KAF7432900.1 GTP cyclohydrolase II [Pleurotus ostreatus]KAJ8698522.1 GTP cyclohydrolase II [Pleurotus ostreatus]
MRHHGSECCASDDALLEALTGPIAPSPKSVLGRRDAALDPLLIAAAFASGPHVTRNHYHHDFFPGVMMPQEEGGIDWSKFTGDDAAEKEERRRRLVYVSRQAPRSKRLQHESDQDGKENNVPCGKTNNLPLATPKKRRQSVAAATGTTNESETAPSTSAIPPPVVVKCMARTRIPTPHGPAFLHLYHNNRDNKEHLAIVIDPAQLTDTVSSSSVPHIRSQSLDSVWSDSETEMDRITRGAFVGKLSPTKFKAAPPVPQRLNTNIPNHAPPPLIRIHSECFTGETVGSMRCDCGEQLDEAIRLISQPIPLPTYPPTQIPGRGAVIYLRQEGRGIGLLSKIRAYNLQDLGHDTVTANIMLGHKADERGYEIAGAILRDLGLGSEQSGEGVRVLTNNPDKIQALADEGVKVVERVPMIPRSWKARNPNLAVVSPHLGIDGLPKDAGVDSFGRSTGATLIGGGAVHGEDLDKYLRTKVLRMGHMLPLWLEDPEL